MKILGVSLGTKNGNNDTMCRVALEAAKYSAAQVIVEEAFEPIREETRKKALLCMEQCPEVICCLTHFGTINQENKILLETARRQKKLKNL